MKKNDAIKKDKKAYDMPRLKEWGTLSKLTHGGSTGLEDDPDMGGSGASFAPPWTKQ